ncbi:MAG TPA: branched-chain amino acid ABC transporter permease [Hyphomicrobiaceae bacterium]|nr:branched-chain amino acid ABC transporter permease [Hyphomicrobiaceae bacterium]
MEALGPFLEILIGGLLAGVLYSLVALGFVLIFKASGVFNFAQGAMVLVAGLALVRSLDYLAAQGVPMWGATILGLLFAAAVMAIAAWLIQRFALGPLVNQDALTLFMATIGVTFILEGAGQMIFGSDVYPLHLLPSNAWFLFEGTFPGGVLVDQLDVLGGLIAGVLVAALAAFFQWTKTGRALRAVADDHAAAQSVGIPIAWIWFVVWLVAGLVALVAAAVWGTKLSVQFSITFLALKALPVLIIGGFTSVPGAIVGGLLVGAGEKLAEAYLGPYIGGGIEYWFAYVLALVVLLGRPQGLFGERIIERI